jgi:signal transduction histidine kinase
MLKVLVVENEPNPRESLAATLKDTYFDVDSANNTAAALLKAQTHLPALIICDSSSLQIDGAELLELVRADSKTRIIPFILISKSYDRAAMRRAMNLGADDYLVKPITSDDLLASVIARLERQRALVEDAEVRLDATKRSLARMLTHELRTPLISMNTAIDILSREAKMFSPEELRDLLDSLAAGSTRLSHRVEQLAFLTQLQTSAISKRSIARRGIESRLSDLVMASINLARRFMGKRETTQLIKQGDTAPDAVVLCNPSALKQALAELIANALAFSPPNGAVYVGQKYVAEGVRVTITDEGPGIPEGKLASVMEAFSQLERESTEQQGLGIGLALAQRLIDAHGGRLEMRSIPGKGTQALAFLPVVAQAAPSAYEDDTKPIDPSIIAQARRLHIPPLQAPTDAPDDDETDDAAARLLFF